MWACSDWLLCLAVLALIKMERTDVLRYSRIKSCFAVLGLPSSRAEMRGFSPHCPYFFFPCSFYNFDIDSFFPPCLVDYSSTLLNNMSCSPWGDSAGGSVRNIARSLFRRLSFPFLRRLSSRLSLGGSSLNIPMNRRWATVNISYWRRATAELAEYLLLHCLGPLPLVCFSHLRYGRFASHPQTPIPTAASISRKGYYCQG